jgi:single-stranded DNA-binding protein
MIRALVSGTLYDAPRGGLGRNGKPFTTAKVKAEGKNGDAVWVSCVAFGDMAEKLAMQAAKAPISVVGKIEVSIYTAKTGEPKAGLSMVVEDCAALETRPRSAARPGPAQTQEPPAPPPPATFDDFDEWELDTGG